jgi:hypothetical protein
MDGKIIGRRVRLGQCSFPLRASVRDSLPSGILCLSSKPMDIPIVLSQSYAGLLKHGGETLVLFLC